MPVKAGSSTIVIPDDYSKISDAVGNATEGATIYLKKGIYEIKENSLGNKQDTFNSWRRPDKHHNRFSARHQNGLRILH